MPQHVDDRHNSQRQTLLPHVSEDVVVHQERRPRDEANHPRLPQKGTQPTKRRTGGRVVSQRPPVLAWRHPAGIPRKRKTNVSKAVHQHCCIPKPVRLMLSLLALRKGEEYRQIPHKEVANLARGKYMYITTLATGACHDSRSVLNFAVASTNI